MVEKTAQQEGVITQYLSLTGLDATIPAAQPESPLGPVLHPCRILVVDDDALCRELIARKLSSEGHVCESCFDIQGALDLLAAKKFDLVLAGFPVHESGGLALVQEMLKFSPDTAVILVTSVINIEVAVDALKHGASDYITKPLSLEEMSISVSRALEKRKLLLENRKYQRMLEEQVASRTRQLQETLDVLQNTYHSTLVALSKALDSRDADSDGHSLRVTVYAKHIARRLGLGEAEIRTVEQGVLLHDIGKIGIPDELLRKKCNLNESEQLLIRRHPEIGCRILSSIKFLKEAALVVYHHHELYDGEGYPQGLKGDQIVLGARIFAVADALDDFTSGNALQEPIPFEDAVQEIAGKSGFELDPAVVSEFVRIPVEEWNAIRKGLADTTRRADFLSLEATSL